MHARLSIISTAFAIQIETSQFGWIDWFYWDRPFRFISIAPVNLARNWNTDCCDVKLEYGLDLSSLAAGIMN